MSTRIKKIVIIAAILVSLPIVKIIILATINLGIYLGVIIRTICEKIVF